MTFFTNPYCPLQKPAHKGIERLWCAKRAIQENLASRRSLNPKSKIANAYLIAGMASIANWHYLHLLISDLDASGQNIIG